MAFELPLTRDAFVDALRKGLGRALLHVREHGVAGLESTLLDACRTNWVFDAQCEGTRGSWLWEIVSETGLRADVRAIVIDGLSREPNDDHWTLLQHGEIAAELMREGDREIRSLYYRAVASSRRAVKITHADGPTDAAIYGPGLDLAPILELDGLEGWLEVVRLLGGDAGPWSNEILEEAQDAFGAEALTQALTAAAQQDSEVAAYARRLDGRRNVARQDGTFDPLAPPLRRSDERTAAQLLAEIHAAVATVPLDAPYWPSAGALSWGRSASASARSHLVEALWSESDPRVLHALLCAFQWRGLPAFDARLITLCRSDDEHVSNRAQWVLVRHPGGPARAFALEQQLSGHGAARTIDLLAANWRAGDERVLAAIAAAHRGQPPEAVHDVAFALAGMFRHAGPERTELTELALFVWDESPCANCREYAATWLASAGRMPPWLRAEAAHDSQPGIRELVDEVR